VRVWLKISPQGRSTVTAGGLINVNYHYHLLRLKLGDALTHITTGKSTRRLIAPTEELLAGWQLLEMSQEVPTARAQWSVSHRLASRPQSRCHTSTAITVFPAYEIGTRLSSSRSPVNE
jgi:hypothetical protein